MTEGKVVLKQNDVNILINKKNDFIDKDKSQLKLHVIAYIDFLGTTKKISSEEQLTFLKEIKHIYHATALKYEEIREYLNKTLYKKIKEENEEVKFSDIANPAIKYKIFSDNIILAIEIPTKEPYMCESYTLDLYSRMITICSQFQALAIFNGLLLRGGITVGDLYLDETFVYGNGLLEAYRMENNLAHFPRIILNKNIANKLSKNEKSFLKDIDEALYVDYYNQLSLTNYITEDMAKHIKYKLIELKEKALDEKSVQKVGWAIDYHNRYFKEHSNEEKYLIKYLIES